MLLLPICLSWSSNEDADELFKLFKNPPAEAKAFVRWWWNGNRVNEKEVLRELDLLRDAGFGGVEINPIAMPPVTGEPMQKQLEWLSPEWNQVLKTACEGAKDRGMIADLLVGSGWPFGGRFLKPDQTIQRIAVNYKDISRDSRGKIQDVSYEKQYIRLRSIFVAGWRRSRKGNWCSCVYFLLTLVILQR